MEERTETGGVIRLRDFIANAEAILRPTPVIIQDLYEVVDDEQVYVGSREICCDEHPCSHCQRDTRAEFLTLVALGYAPLIAYIAAMVALGPLAGLLAVAWGALFLRANIRAGLWFMDANRFSPGPRRLIMAMCLVVIVSVVTARRHAPYWSTAIATAAAPPAPAAAVTPASRTAGANARAAREMRE